MASGHASWRAGCRNRCLPKPLRYSLQQRPTPGKVGATTRVRSPRPSVSPSPYHSVSFLFSPLYRAAILLFLMAMASAFLVPTSTTSFLARVTAV